MSFACRPEHESASLRHDWTSIRQPRPLTVLADGMLLETLGSSAMHLASNTCTVAQNVDVRLGFGYTLLGASSTS
eukprot:2720029-Pleurochrysis_carterae.AAC.1